MAAGSPDTSFKERNSPLKLLRKHVVVAGSPDTSFKWRRLTNQVSADTSFKRVRLVALLWPQIPAASDATDVNQNKPRGVVAAGPADTSGVNTSFKPLISL